MLRKALVFVLLLSVICLSSAAVAVEMKRIGEEPKPATVTPGIRVEEKIETLTLDVSCFLDDEPIAVRVFIVQIDSAGTMIARTQESETGEDGRVRFTVIKGKNYRVNAWCKDDRRHPESASEDIFNISHSTVLTLHLTR
jgi:hypothetical protein